MHAAQFARNEETTPQHERQTSFREQLDATSHLVVGAAEGHVRDAIESVGWERRGLLRRLTRNA